MNYKNNNNEGNQYFVGPTCTDGKYIHLQVYTEETCSTTADIGVDKDSYGTGLPYSPASGRSLVEYSDCLSCVKKDDQIVPSELCKRSVQAAAKCEANMKSAYADVSGCEFIHHVLPSIENLSTPTTTDQSSTMEILAWTFGSTTILLSIALIFVVSRRRLVTEKAPAAECGAVEPVSEVKLQLKD
jgi:hypothetical protein